MSSILAMYLLTVILCFFASMILIMVCSDSFHGSVKLFSLFFMNENQRPYELVDSM